MHSKVINLASFACNAIGVVLLYKGSFAFLQAPYISSSELEKQRVRANRRLKCLQRVGMAFLLASIALQAGGLFVPD